MNSNVEAIVDPRMIEQQAINAKVNIMVDIVLKNLEFPENLSDDAKQAYIEKVRNEKTEEYTRNAEHTLLARREPKKPFVRGEPKPPPARVEQTQQPVRVEPNQHPIRELIHELVSREPTEHEFYEIIHEWVRGEPKQPFVRREPTQQPVYVEKTRQFVRGKPTQPVRGEPKQQRVPNELFAQVLNETSNRFENECKVPIDSIDPDLIAKIQNLVPGERSIIVHQVPLSDDNISVTVKGVVLNFSKRKFIKNMMAKLLHHYTPIFPKSERYKVFVGVDKYSPTPRFIVSVGVFP